MELKDTIELMISSDYKERFKAEHYQTIIRYTKLKDMIRKWDSGELGFVPTSPREILVAQLNAMRVYLYFLEERANIEKIDL